MYKRQFIRPIKFELFFEQMPFELLNVPEINNITWGDICFSQQVNSRWQVLPVLEEGIVNLFNL